MYTLEQSIRREQLACTKSRSAYLEFIKAELAPRYAEFIGQRDPEGLSRILFTITGRTCSIVTCRLCGRLD